MKLLEKSKGLTLIELIVAVVIVAILAVVSIKIYSTQVRQGRRVDGINVLLNISLAEERYRSNNSTYGTLAQVWNGVSTSPEAYYSLSISGVSATGYTATATAQGDQAKDAVNAVSCTTLTLTMSSGTITKAPSACWPT